MGKKLMMRGLKSDKDWYFGNQKPLIEQKNVQMSMLCVWRGEDRTEVLKCMISAFSWFWSLSYHFSPLFDTLKTAKEIHLGKSFLRFHFLVSILKSVKYIKIALQLFATYLLNITDQRTQEKNTKIFLISHPTCIPILWICFLFF